MSTPSNSDRFRAEKDDSGCLDLQQDQPHDLPRAEPSPVVRLQRITEQGLVFESWRSFEVGIFIDFGMHVPGRPAQGTASGSRDHKPSFLNLEGFVVDCQADCQSCGRNPSYQVSIMFSDLDATDRALLKELEVCVRPKPAVPTPATSMSRHDMLLAQLEEVFGLN